MREYIIIAGPQAAGKSTVITQLSEQYRNIVPFLSRASKKIPVLLLPLQESRQIIVHKNVIFGAIFMSQEDEEQVVRCDLRRMDLILKRQESQSQSLIYLDECNVFTIAHAAAHGVTQIGAFRREYIQRLERLNAKIVFLDIQPQVSWSRRKRRYEERLVYFPEDQHKEIMTRYQEYIEKLYPALLNLYNELPFPKRMISADCTLPILLQRVSEALVQLSSLFVENRTK